MPNVIYAKDIFAPPLNEPVFNVDPIMTLMEKLHVGGILGENAYRLGAVVCAYMQMESSHIVELSHQIAAQTATVLDDEPHACQVSTELIDFVEALQELQAYVGIYSHPKRANLLKLKDRFTHFTQKHGYGSSEVVLPKSKDMIFFQFRPEEIPYLREDAEHMIYKKLWVCRFAQIVSQKTE